MQRKYVFNFFIIIIFLFSFFGSIVQSFYVYDPYHWGLAQSSIDFLSGKTPYKEFFIHYGFLSVITKAFFLKIFNYDILSGMYLSSLAYSLGNIILCIFIVDKFYKNKIEIPFIATIIFFIHPFANHPWYNYEFYLFILLSIFFLISEKKNFFLSGIFLSLACLLFEYFFFPSLLILFYIFFLYTIRNFSYFLFGFLIPILIFIIYLLDQNIFFDWYKTFTISKSFFKIYDLNYLTLIFNFFGTFLYKSINRVFFEPYYFIFLLIFLTNFLFFVKFNYDFFVKRKNKVNKNLFLISLFALVCCLLALHKVNIFRLSTGLIIGIITLFYYINLKFFNIRKQIYFSIAIILSLNFFVPIKKENNRTFPKFNEIINGIGSNKFNLFSSQRWLPSDWKILTKYSDLNQKIKKKCIQIEKFINFTNDGFYYMISNQYFNSDQYLYWHENIKTHYLLMGHFNKNIIDLIKKFNDEKTFIVVDSRDLLFIKNLIYPADFKILELPFSYKLKRKIIILPANCYNSIDYDQ